MRLNLLNRRELITFVSAATVWPLEAARAQQSLARIGFLPLGSPSNQHDLSWVEVFRKALIENGLIEGRNIILDVVWVANDFEYDQAANELVRRGATVLVPVGSSASAACKRQTSTIPIVFMGVGNPVGIGIVESLSHPGGNVTGFADLTVDLSGKLLEFARELTPAGKPIGYLWYDKWLDGQNWLLAIEQAAKASGVTLQARAISDVIELDSVVAERPNNRDYFGNNRMDEIDADYLVVGAGATAMAFVDTLLTESDARIAMVDRRHRPGGHWNDAYPFVCLHQPSATYGVNSRELGGWIKDEIGLNAGFYGLASGLEVLNHFDQVMRERFLPSGRVRWLPMNEYRAGPGGAHEITSLINGDVAQIVPRKKLVDATHAQTAVPSTHPPTYAVAAGVKCIPPTAS